MNTTNPALAGLAGLGLGPKEPTAHVEPHTIGNDDSPVIQTGPKQRPLVTGSATARTLYRIITGERITVVKSPPGGGKTEMIVTVAAHLANRLGLSFVIGVARKEQGIALSHRLIQQIDPDRVVVTLNGVDQSLLPYGVLTSAVRGSKSGKGTVSVRTIASLKMSRMEEQRLLLIDEAYQSTWEQVASAASSFAQIVMVGDPGQIGPVVRTDTSAYERLSKPPHHPAPVVFERHESAGTLSVDKTYRLGQESVDAIAPLYDFPFTSGRPQRTLTNHKGRVLAEIEHIAHPEVDRSEDVDLMWAVTHRAASLVGCIQESVERDGSVTERALDQSDVAVVVALNAQVSIVSGMLASLDMDEITVGTADRLQGGEWAAVVALDPTAGGGAAEHNLSLGRLCVMASRHTTHLTWVHDGSWNGTMPKVGGSKTTQLNRKVREALTAHPAS